MAAAIQYNPKTVSIFGDSYTSNAFVKDAGIAYSPLSSIGAGGRGSFLVLDDRSVGGCTAQHAMTDTGPWRDILTVGGPFDFSAAYDIAEYQMFRYGINEAVAMAYGVYVFSLEDFEYCINAMVSISQGVGRKPLLCTPPVLPVRGLMTQTSVSRLDDVRNRIRRVATLRNVPLVELGDWTFTAQDMADDYHPSAILMNALNMDLGGRLGEIIKGGY
ncbi:MAG: SGNH/GDSL hydrolase family protein [Proteobacteria bacterium]|nr:SGNH/GDSL hydrolase family protein [Pseudomonadota bacterium]